MANMDLLKILPTHNQNVLLLLKTILHRGWKGRSIYGKIQNLAEKASNYFAFGELTIVKILVLMGGSGKCVQNTRGACFVHPL